jgi:hypothetical protein
MLLEPLQHNSLSAFFWPGSVALQCFLQSVQYMECHMSWTVWVMWGQVVTTLASFILFGLVLHLECWTHNHIRLFPFNITCLFCCRACYQLLCVMCTVMWLPATSKFASSAMNGFHFSSLQYIGHGCIHVCLLYFTVLGKPLKLTGLIASGQGVYLSFMTQEYRV